MNKYIDQKFKTFHDSIFNNRYSYNELINPYYYLVGHYEKLYNDFLNNINEVEIEIFENILLFKLVLDIRRSFIISEGDILSNSLNVNLDYQIPKLYTLTNLSLMTNISKSKKFSTDTMQMVIFLMKERLAEDQKLMNDSQFSKLPEFLFDSELAFYELLIRIVNDLGHTKFVGELEEKKVDLSKGALNLFLK